MKACIEWLAESIVIGLFIAMMLGDIAAEYVKNNWRLGLLYI